MESCALHHNVVLLPVICRSGCLRSGRFNLASLPFFHLFLILPPAPLGYHLPPPLPLRKKPTHPPFNQLSQDSLVYN